MLWLGLVSFMTSFPGSFLFLPRAILNSAGSNKISPSPGQFHYLNDKTLSKTHPPWGFNFSKETRDQPQQGSFLEGEREKTLGRGWYHPALWLLAKASKEALEPSEQALFLRWCGREGGGGSFHKLSSPSNTQTASAQGAALAISVVNTNCLDRSFIGLANWKLDMMPSS